MSSRHPDSVTLNPDMPGEEAFDEELSDMFLRCSEMQRSFLLHYIGDCFGNSRMAALKAGYSPNVARNFGHKLTSKNVHTRAFLRAYFRKCGFTRGELASRLRAIVEGDVIGEALVSQEVIHDDGTITNSYHVDIERVKESGNTHLIESVKVSASGAVTVKCYSKLTALDMIAKLGGWYRPTAVDVTSGGEKLAKLTDMSNDDLSALETLLSRNGHVPKSEDS